MLQDYNVCPICHCGCTTGYFNQHHTSMAAVTWAGGERYVGLKTWVESESLSPHQCVCVSEDKGSREQKHYEYQEEMRKKNTGGKFNMLLYTKAAPYKLTSILVINTFLGLFFFKSTNQNTVNSSLITSLRDSIFINTFCFVFANYILRET